MKRVVLLMQGGMWLSYVHLSAHLTPYTSPGVSKVLHVRNVSPETSHEELVAFVSQFGSVVASECYGFMPYLLLITQKYAFCPSSNKLSWKWRPHKLPVQ